MQAVLDAVWRHLLPAFRSAPLTGADAEDEALRTRLDALAVPPLTASAVPAEPDAWSAAPFLPAADAAVGPTAGAPVASAVGLTSVALAPLPDGGRTLTLTDPGGDLVSLRQRTPGWTVTERPDAPVPVAVTAAGPARHLHRRSPVPGDPSPAVADLLAPGPYLHRRWHTAAMRWDVPRSHGSLTE